MTDIDREIGRDWERFEGCDDSNRAYLLNELANHYETSCAWTTAALLHLLADAESTATGERPQRLLTGTRWEPALGSLLDRMAGTADVHERAALVEQIAELVPDGIAREVLTELPYAPADRTWRGLVRTVRWLWRERRAA